MSKLNGTTTIKGTNTRFKVPVEDFIISPLSANSTLHVVMNVGGTEKDTSLATLDANKPSKIHGGVAFLEYYVATSETFTVKW